MKLIPTAIPDVVLIEPAVYEDERGWFMETFNEQRFRAELRKLGQPEPAAFVQDNHSLSHRGVLRGLHFQQPPYAQGKLVRVIQGSVWDVAVDIRPCSTTYGKWVAETLSAENHRMLWIPEGFAHGFLALEEGTQLIYKVTSYYKKEAEGSYSWNSPDLNISWPKDYPILLSQKDAQAPAFSFKGRL